MYKFASVLGVIALSTAATAATSVANPAAKRDNNPATQKYCLRLDPTTGSRIRRTECRTKAEWNELGVDVDALLSKTDTSSGYSA